MRWFRERLVPLSFTRCQALNARKNEKLRRKKVWVILKKIDPVRAKEYWA